MSYFFLFLLIFILLFIFPLASHIVRITMTDDDSRQIGRIFKPLQDSSLYFITEFKRKTLMFYGFTFEFQILAGQYSYYTVYTTDKSNIRLVSQFLLNYREC
jgi:hypothetical protein